MKHIGILKSDVFATALNVVGIPAALVYFVSMFVYPAIASGLDWQYMQNVWDRWQGLNVGMLAFTSSITAFNISRFNANKQREREFLASKAFLPDALSELTSYLISSAALFQEGWGAEHGEKIHNVAASPPLGYKEVFRECIRHAERDVGDFLVRILVLLQLHTTRLERYIGRQGEDTWYSPEKHNLLIYIYRIGELQAMIYKLFRFSRSTAPLDSKPLSWEDFRSAYGELGVWADQYYINSHDTLETFTQRALQREDLLDMQQET